MRVIQLRANGSEESELDFHPMLTVVSSLSRTARDRILKAFTAVPSGSDPGCRGLVEAHGVLLDLTTETLKLLELSSDLDVLVRATDVPGGGPIAGSNGAAVRLTAEQFIAQTPEGAYPVLDQARAGQAGSREALSILRDASDRSRRDLAQAEERHASAVARLEAARVALVAEAAEPTPEPEAVLLSAEEVALRRTELEEEIAEAEAEVARATRGLEELSTIDTRPIQVLLDAIRNPAPVEYVPSDRGQDLADRFVSLQAEVGALEARLEEQGLGPTTAMQRLEDARTEVQIAEHAMAKPNVSPEDRAELEAAHEEVLETEKKISGLLKKGGQRRFDEAVAHQQAVLDRIGFPTWSAYVMGASLMSIDPLAEQRLERARFELESAEAHWAQITTLIEADPTHSALLDQLEGLYLEAFDLLGGDDEREDIESALRSLKVPKREVTTEELIDALAYQLELVGLDLGGQSGPDYTVMVADAFLEEAGAIDEREAELQAERSSADTKVAALHAELDELVAEPTIDLTGSDHLPEPGSGADTASDVHESDLESLELEVAATLEGVTDSEEMLEAREALVDAATRIDAVESAKLVRTATELAERASLSTTVRPASDPAFDVEAGDDGADAGQEAIEFYLLSRLAAQRNVSYAGSVPLVLDDALAGVPANEITELLGKLERMSQAVQVVLLTDDPTVVGWAEAVGLDRAAAIMAPSTFG